jgi:hypothetical protein
MHSAESSGQPADLGSADAKAGPQPIPGWPVHLVLSAAIGFVLWFAYGGGYVSLDAMWSLVWGRDLLAAEPLAISGTTTPHVLSNLIGAVLAPLGPDADRALVAVEFLAAGALVWLTGLLAREIAGTVAGITAGVLMALREQLLYATTSTFLDVLVATFVVWAALLLVRGLRPAADGRRWPAPPASPAAPLVLLLLAGLLRPEPWVLAGVLWLWWWRAGASDRSAGRTVGLAALVAAAPASWLVFDAVLAGDPLFSVHETGRVNALVRAGKEIPDTLKEHVISIPRNIAHAAGPEIIIVVAVMALVLLAPSVGRRKPLNLVALPEAQRGPVLVLLAGATLYAGVLAAEALTGSLLFARFAIALTGVLIAVTAVGLAAVAAALRPAAPASWIPVAVMAAVLALAQLPLLIDARTITGEEHDRYDVARAAVVLGVPCTPVVVPNTNIRAYIAVWADVRGDEVLDAGKVQPPERATYITATGAEPDKLLRDPSFPQTDVVPITNTVREQGGWIVAETCGTVR